MAIANIRAVITAEDQASKVVQSFGTNIDKANDKVVSSNQKTTGSFNQMLVATAGMGVATHKLVGIIDSSIDAANKYQNALLGLTSISKAFGHNVDQAKDAAESLAKDGLMTVADSARGLKNLLQSGFSLPEAIKLMERFKDSAAFGKQGALEFGEAIVGATEGIKNGNSILVDNAGVTKNLSRILEEAGFSAQDLMRATTDVNVRQALFNGIIKETNANVGDAQKLTETYAGKQAMLTAKTTILKQQIGEALQPVIAKLLETITPMVERFAKFAADHPQVVAAILIITTVGLGLLAVLGSIGLAVMGLGPIFSAFAVVAQGAIGAVSLAFKGMALLVTTGLIMPAIAVGAALASLALVYNAAQKTKQAVDNTLAAAQTASRINDDTIRTLQGLIKNGTPEQQARARSTLAGLAAGGSFASGTNYAPGGLSLVGEQGAELVNLPRGSQVIPNNKISAGGDTVNVNINVGALMGSDVEARKFAMIIKKHLQEAASAKNMSLSAFAG